jgi:hypothetical protein
MEPVPLSAFFEARLPQSTTPAYRRGWEKAFGQKREKKPQTAYGKGWEKIYGKKAQARREKEAEARRKEKEKEIKQEKKRAAQQQQKQKKLKEKQQKQKIQTIAKEKLDRRVKAQERRAMAKKRGQPPRPPGLNTIPAQIAHCMMAVHKKRGKSKEAAWNICRWAMTKYGYLKGPYRRSTKLQKAVKQTPKGVRRSFQHGMEKHPLGGGLPGTGVSKYNRFIKMFKDVENDFLLKKDRK